jgi:hypothetical protein
MEMSGRAYTPPALSQESRLLTIEYEAVRALEMAWISLNFFCFIRWCCLSWFDSPSDMMIRYSEREWLCKKANSAYIVLFLEGAKKLENSFRFFSFRFVMSLLTKSEILPK